jgi:hypothetical protein
MRDERKENIVQRERHQATEISATSRQLDQKKNNGNKMQLCQPYDTSFSTKSCSVDVPIK